MTAIATIPKREIHVPAEMIKRIKQEVFASLSKSLKVEHPSLEDYFKAAWPIIEPSNPLEDVWVLGYLAEHLEAVAQRQILRLAISMHPRSLKSILTSIMFPTWDWITRPWEKFMSISYSQDLSVDHSIKRRRILESDWYREKWGTIFQLMPDQNRKNVFENTASGMMLATSAGGTATGKGANIMIFDDFINPKEAESDAERKTKIDDYSHTFSSRLNNPKRDAIIIVNQRTHTNDLTGHVLKEGGYVHVDLPVVLADRVVYSFPLSHKEKVREAHEVLNPARQDTTTLEKQKRASGSRAFSAQWLCRPSSDEGNMVKRYWWKFYKDDPKTIQHKMQVVANSWDFAFKDLEDNSFVVGLTIGRIGTQKYLLGEIRDHLDFTQTCRAVIAADSAWIKTNYNFYEDKANGPAVKSALATKVRALIAVEPLGSKAARMSTILPDIEAGDVLLPYAYDDSGNPRADRTWVLDFIEELARFPEEPNDRGDALSQGIIKLNNVLLDDGQTSEEGGSLFDFNGQSELMPETMNLGGFEEFNND